MVSPGEQMAPLACGFLCRIIDDFGGAFAMGAIGGSFWHGIKGYRNSPSGMKLRSSIGAVKARAPVLGGTLLAFGK
jgi:import inner membrane translocase subunit TIM17